MLLASADISAAFAQSRPGNHHASGWIFISILGIPFLLGLLGLLKPDLLESFIRAWPWEKRPEG
jgi:hypothetical protein